MLPQKADIIARLQREIFPLQGFKPLRNDLININLGRINEAFPNSRFPLAAIHEFLVAKNESAAASAGFIAALLGKLMQNKGAAIWISSQQNIFPPALHYFGIEPHQLIFIHQQKQKHIQWIIEEALKCEGLAAVVGEIKDFNFMASRRLQLAVEQSRVTGFILHHCTSPSTTASIAKWKITSLSSLEEDGLPGLGFPHWQVEILKSRNGKPGSWQIEWKENAFREIPIREIGINNSQPGKSFREIPIVNTA